MMEIGKLNSNLAPIGVVECRNQNGELLFRKNNMIVSTGRQYIMTHDFSSSVSSIYSCIGSDSSLTTANDSLAKFPESFNFSSTTENNITYYTYRSINDASSNAYFACPTESSYSNINNLSISVANSNFTAIDTGNNNAAVSATNDSSTNFLISNANTDSLTATFKIYYMSNNATLTATSLGLYFYDSSTPTLFSRVTFPPILYSSSQALEFTYYIYF